MPYSELPQTTGTRERSTVRTGSRCELLGDDQDRSAGVLALILQNLFELTPARIQDGLGHSGLSKLGTAHITYDNTLIPIDDSTAELVLGIPASVRRSAV